MEINLLQLREAVRVSRVNRKGITNEFSFLCFIKLEPISKALMTPSFRGNHVPKAPTTNEWIITVKPFKQFSKRRILGQLFSRHASQHILPIFKRNAHVNYINGFYCLWFNEQVQPLENIRSYYNLDHLIDEYFDPSSSTWASQSFG